MEKSKNKRKSLEVPFFNDFFVNCYKCFEKKNQEVKTTKGFLLPDVFIEKGGLIIFFWRKIDKLRSSEKKLSANFKPKLLILEFQ